MKCAIYTRKSSEEGLEQDFNSLAAQREACEAYIISQRSQGWRALKTRYDDGGYSGGNLDRPALQQLLGDVDAGRIQVVVVYKIDRLTRSLADFARLVDRFDAHDVSIVAVTQPFNTTTSMGRLTLNVLLSFAQFEREITGERIRDKIAASKQKGLWMGGVLPLGYDVRDRQLVPNQEEAATVRHIFKRYIALRSVRLLKEELDRDGFVSKRRPGRQGTISGGRPFSRGALYTLLRNALYIGKIRHGEHLYDGQHPGIVEETIFSAAQTLLTKPPSSGSSRRRSQSLLAGILFDGEGHRMSPAHTKRHSQRYRYYVSQQVLHGGRSKTLARVAAHEIEQAVIDALAHLLREENNFTKRLSETSPQAIGTLRTALHRELKRLADPENHAKQLRVLLHRVELTNSALRLTVNMTALIQHRDCQNIRASFDVPIRIARCQHGKKVLLEAARKTCDPDPKLVGALLQAHQWHKVLVDPDTTGFKDLGRLLGVEHNYIRRIHQLVFLAPDIQLAILEGRQPPDLTLERLTKPARIPPAFEDQRRTFGFSDTGRT